MPPKQIIFEKNQPVHVISRAVEGIKIFINKDNCYRLIFQAYAANLGSPAPNLFRRDINKAGSDLLQGKEISSKLVIKSHSPLVHILDFSLVINHYHFYLLSAVENGISFFMQRLNTGFAKYLNLKIGRRGTLFESRYKRVLVKSEFQSDAVSRYVSIINPLDVFQPGWREEGLKDLEGALEFLKNYEFSSFPDKIGKRKSKILAPDDVQKIYSPEGDFKNKEEYLKVVKDFLLGRTTDDLNLLFLE